MVTSVTAPGCCCECSIIFGFVCAPFGNPPVVYGLMFTTNGPLCLCSPPTIGCAPTGPGHEDLTLACATQPRIGSVFTVTFAGSGIQHHLIVGPNRSSPTDLNLCPLVNRLNYLWVDPWYFVPTTVNPPSFSFALPLEPSLIGYSIGCQGLSSTGSVCPPPLPPAPLCYLTTGLRVTLQP